MQAYEKEVAKLDEPDVRAEIERFKALVQTPHLHTGRRRAAPNIFPATRS